MQKKDCVCPPEGCDTFQFMSKNLGMRVLHPGGIQATEKLAEKCHITSDMTVLDAGCGRGSSSVFLAKTFGCRVVGVDVDAASLIKAQNLARHQKVSDKVSFRLGDLNDLSPLELTFDGAIFQASLIFCNKPATLKAVTGKIKPNGFLGAVELTWKTAPSPYIAARVKAVLCAAATNSEQQSGWEDLFGQAGLTVTASEIGGLDFGFGDMAINEGYLSASRIALKSIFNGEVRRKIGSITKLFKETDPYLGYGIYVCRKTAVDRGASEHPHP